MSWAATCIDFDTHFGTTLQANQLCVDKAHGYLVRWQVGDEVIENSGFFAIGNLWERAKFAAPWVALCRRIQPNWRTCFVTNQSDLPPQPKAG